jgi:hypothetical protein
MTHITTNFKAERNVSTVNFQAGITTYTVADNTITFSNVSPTNTAWVGSTVGQIINLGNATQYENGHEFWFYNESNVLISIRYSDNTSFYELPPKVHVKVILRDNSTTNGVWVLVVTPNFNVGSGLMRVEFWSPGNSNNSWALVDNHHVGNSNVHPFILPYGGVLAASTFSSTTNNSGIDVELYRNDILTAIWPVRTSRWAYKTDWSGVILNQGDKLSLFSRAVTGATQPANIIYHLYIGFTNFNATTGGGSTL